MNTQSDERALVDLLNRFVFKCREQDLTIADDFAEEALLLGSETDEVARGREQVKVHFAGVFEHPYAIGFVFDTIETKIAGDIGWLYAEGAAHLAQNGQERRLPYRLTGVCEYTEAGWRWMLFHGSEPA